MENTVEEKEKIYCDFKNQKVEVTNPGEETKSHLKMILNSRLLDKILDWLLFIGLIALLHYLNINISAALLALPGNAWSNLIQK